MSKPTKTYKPRLKVRGPVANPYAAPPKAELRKQVEAAMASGVPVILATQKNCQSPRNKFPIVALST